MADELTGKYTVDTPAGGGLLIVDREGPYYRLRYRGPRGSGPVRLWARGSGGWLGLGIPCPRGEELCLERRMSRRELSPLGDSLMEVITLPPKRRPEEAPAAPTAVPSPAPAPASPASPVPSAPPVLDATPVTPSSPASQPPLPSPAGWERLDPSFGPGAFFRRDAQGLLAALPLDPGRAFPFPASLRYGTVRVLEDRLYLVFRLKNGVLCPL